MLEPNRVANPCVTYLEASCTALDTDAKVAVCEPAARLPDGTRPPFRVSYDVAVLACGEAPATLGVPGVAEHCFFLKEIADAAALRRRVGECFDLAALPSTSAADRDNLLHFVVVGCVRYQPLVSTHASLLFCAVLRCSACCLCYPQPVLFSNLHAPPAGAPRAWSSPPRWRGSCGPTWRPSIRRRWSRRRA